MPSWTVDERNVGERTDRFLAASLGVSRSEAQRLLEQGAAGVNDAAAKPNHILRIGDVVSAEIPDPVIARVQPEAIPLDILFEDPDLLVINKPRGMVTRRSPTRHPASDRRPLDLVALRKHSAPYRSFSRSRRLFADSQSPTRGSSTSPTLSGLSPERCFSPATAQSAFATSPSGCSDDLRK